MVSPGDKKPSDLPSSKRQKTEGEEEMKTKTEDEEEIKTSDGNNDKPYYDYDSDEIYEETRRWNAEVEITGPFDIDASKYSQHIGMKQLDLDATFYDDESKTKRDMIEMLTNASLDKYNADEDKKLKLDKIEKVNFHLSGGVTYYISFQVIDPSEDDGDQIKPYQAVVRRMPGDELELISCNPKPS